MGSILERHSADAMFQSQRLCPISYLTLVDIGDGNRAWVWLGIGGRPSRLGRSTRRSAYVRSYYSTWNTNPRELGRATFASSHSRSQASCSLYVATQTWFFKHFDTVRVYKCSFHELAYRSSQSLSCARSVFKFCSVESNRWRTRSGPKTELSNAYHMKLFRLLFPLLGLRNWRAIFSKTVSICLARSRWTYFLIRSSFLPVTVITLTPLSLQALVILEFICNLFGCSVQ